MCLCPLHCVTCSSRAQVTARFGAFSHRCTFAFTGSVDTFSWLPPLSRNVQRSRVALKSISDRSPLEKPTDVGLSHQDGAQEQHVSHLGNYQPLGPSKPTRV